MKTIKAIFAVVGIAMILVTAAYFIGWGIGKTILNYQDKGEAVTYQYRAVTRFDYEKCPEMKAVAKRVMKDNILTRGEYKELDAMDDACSMREKVPDYKQNILDAIQ